MNYKISTIFLAIISIGLIAYIVYNQKPSIPDDALKSNQDSIDPHEGYDELEAFLTQSFSSLSTSTGDFINVKQAHEMIEGYHSEMRRLHGASYNRKRAIYGFTFGLDKIDTFLDKIKDYNSRNPSDKLIGVRIYFGRKAQPGSSSYNDVFLIPVKASGGNYYQVDDQFNPKFGFVSDSLYILNNSNPCPTQCDNP